MLNEEFENDDEGILTMASQADLGLTTLGVINLNMQIQTQGQMIPSNSNMVPTVTSKNITLM